MQKLRKIFFKTVSVGVFLALGLVFIPSLHNAHASDATIASQLQDVGKKLVSQAAKHVLPHKNNKSVTQEGAAYVARYVEIDEKSLVTKLHKAQGSERVGTIKYSELHYVCRGATKEAALNAPCTVEKRRNMTEIIAYTKGKWLYH